MTAVTEHGDIYPCHRYVGQKSFIIGRIDGGVDQSRLRAYFRDVFRVYDRHCASCWARIICGGQCPWYLSKPDGEIVDPDSESCDNIRKGAEKMLWLYATLRRPDQSVEPRNG